MVNKASKVQEKDEIDKIADELSFEEQPVKKAKKTSKKTTKVEPEPIVEDLDEEKVSYREIIEVLCELPKEDFKNVVKVAKQLRKANDMIAAYFGEEEDD